MGIRTRAQALLLAALLGAACVAPPVNLTGDPLKPELYRVQIVVIDAVLFEDAPLRESARDSVSKALLSLGALAKSADSTNTIAKVLGDQVRGLGALAKRTKLGTPLAGSALRPNWRRLRGSLFSDAAWFRQSSADPIEPAEGGPPVPSALRPATANERAGLELALRSIAQLIDRARQDLPNANGSPARLQFADDMGREITWTEGRLGALPERWGPDNYYRNAHRAATLALANLRTLTKVGVGGPRSSREYLIDKAEVQLGRARDAMAKMMPAP